MRIILFPLLCCISGLFVILALIKIWRPKVEKVLRSFLLLLSLSCFFFSSPSFRLLISSLDYRLEVILSMNLSTTRFEISFCVSTSILFRKLLIKANWVETTRSYFINDFVDSWNYLLLQHDQAISLWIFTSYLKSKEEDCHFVNKNLTNYVQGVSNLNVKNFERMYSTHHEGKTFPRNHRSQPNSALEKNGIKFLNRLRVRTRAF